MRQPGLSQRGALFIERFEGFVATPYDDGGAPGVGNATIGIGHLIHLGPVTQADRQRWGTISHARAIQLLAGDSLVAESAISRAITRPLHQWQADALISFVFNVGAGGLAGAVGHQVNAGSPPNALFGWDHFQGRVLRGLEERRAVEYRLYMYGDYADGLPPSPPRTIPDWAWRWVQWRLGRGPFAGHRSDPAWRPLTGAPARIPAWAWVFLRRFR